MGSFGSFPPLTQPDYQPGEPHLEQPLLLTSPYDTQSYNVAQPKPFTIPRKPVGGYSSVPIDDIQLEHHEGNPSVQENHRRPLTWRPSYLRRRIIFSFLILFVGFLIAIEILYQISQRSNGLVFAEERLYYLWTYGPTASMDAPLADL